MAEKGEGRCGETRQSKLSNHSNAEQLKWMDGWFVERSPFWRGQALALEVGKIEHSEHTGVQDAMVFQSSSYGNVLALDGAIQLTQKDECAYQECIVHLPLCSFPISPRSVLVVGGGDGGVVREVVRHPSIERIDVAELDQRVIHLCQYYFPNVACGFSDSRVHLHVTDGRHFVDQCHAESYDAVIVDSSDPVGPGAELFTSGFYHALNRILRPGGVVALQAECMWIHLDTITGIAKSCASAFGPFSARMYASASVPTYPCGQIGFMLCSKPDSNGNAIDLSNPQRNVDAHASLPSLRYYNARVHRCVMLASNREFCWLLIYSHCLARMQSIVCIASICL
jgi:spermidine synthase